MIGDQLSENEMFNLKSARKVSLPAVQRLYGQDGESPGIWQQNCTDNFVSIDARGHVAQCDCRVTSYQGSVL